MPDVMFYGKNVMYALLCMNIDMALGLPRLNIIKTAYLLILPRQSGLAALNSYFLFFCGKAISDSPWKNLKIFVTQPLHTSSRALLCSRSRLTAEVRRRLGRDLCSVTCYQGAHWTFLQIFFLPLAWQAGSPKRTIILSPSLHLSPRRQFLAGLVAPLHSVFPEPRHGSTAFTLYNWGPPVGIPIVSHHSNKCSWLSLLWKLFCLPSGIPQAG